MSVRWSNHGLRRDILKAAFSDWLGLPDAEADLLVALFDLGPEPVSWQLIAMAINSHRPPTQPALWERIRKLRQAMEAEAVDSVEGKGYCLTEVGRAECAKAIADLAGRLAAVGAELELALLS